MRPIPGQVIRYSYLWTDEHERGREEGSKDRPCVIVIAVEGLRDGNEIVMVLPVTHSPPLDRRFAVEIPHTTKRRLGLDDAQSWIAAAGQALFSLWRTPRYIL